jgi:hypothetical protein
MAIERKPRTSAEEDPRLQLQSVKSEMQEQEHRETAPMLKEGSKVPTGTDTDMDIDTAAQTTVTEDELVPDESGSGATWCLLYVLPLLPRDAMARETSSNNFFQGHEKPEMQEDKSSLRCRSRQQQKNLLQNRQT